jgi:hypothetical protein
MMHPEREVPHEHNWVVNERFVPVVGRSYEIAFGKIHYAGEHKHVMKRIRVAGPAPDHWIDLDTENPLDRLLQSCEVKAFRQIA